MNNQPTKTKPEVRYIEATFPQAVTVEIICKDSDRQSIIPEGFQGKIVKVVGLKITRLA